MKLNRKGFTLVELLAVISVLAIVSVIVMYTSVNVIGSAKTKSYLASVSNVEKTANLYVIEENNNIIWKDSSIDMNLQYSCVSVKDLIENGYFKSDVLESMVSENRSLQEDDYIYIERNKISKTITKNMLLIDDDSSYITSCVVVKNIGNIDFSIIPTGWSKEKYVTINYELLRYDSEYNKYLYYSDYDDEVIVNNNFSKLKEQVITKVSKNGVLFAEIKKDDLSLIGKQLNVSKIDNIKPKVKLGSYRGEKEVIGNVEIPIEVIDNESGIKDNSFTIDDIIVMIGDVEITNNIELIKVDINNYNLKINDKLNYGLIKLIIKQDGVFDNVENGNDEIVLETDISLEEPKIVTVTYDFNGGWMKKILKNYTEPGEHIYTVSKTGEYQLEVWGAQGGSYDSTYYGGYGGYSVGNVSLSSGTNLYTNVGGMGLFATNSVAAGGYNGGGTATAKYVSGTNHFYYASGGGGATHIATTSGELSTLSSNSDSILIVAGGGGGAGGAKDSTLYKGGSGGGISGVNGTDAWLGVNSKGKGAYGGTQTSTGTGRYVGGFGYGANSNASSAGGGGYYGGSTGTYGSGGGGSGYIGNSLLTSKYMYCYECKNSFVGKTYTTTNVSGTPISNYAKSGDGAAVVSFLSKENIKEEYDYGSMYREMPAILRNNYMFKGWNTKQDGSGTYITSDTQLVSNKDHTLYAIWTLCGIPEFTYTGNYEIVDDNNKFFNPDLSCKTNWKIRFLTDGTLTITDLKSAASGVDIFLVAGGGKGSVGSNYQGTAGRGGGGGGGGASATVNKFLIKGGISYKLDIGDASKNTSFGLSDKNYYTVLKGSNGNTSKYINNSGWTEGPGYGGDGAIIDDKFISGGNTIDTSGTVNLFGAISILVNKGSNGGDGGATTAGKSGTYEFNGSSGKRYGSGGGAGGGGSSSSRCSDIHGGANGGADGGGQGGTGCYQECLGGNQYKYVGGKSGKAGTANTGGGGGGGGGYCGSNDTSYGSNGSGGIGGSGIIIIRNTRY